MRDKSKIYLIPELLKLSGIDDEVVKDADFMKQLALHTKFEPLEKVKNIESFFNLLNSKEQKVLKDKENNIIGKYNSSIEEAMQYGIEFSNKAINVNNTYLQPTFFMTGKREIDSSKLDRNPVHRNNLNSIDKPILVLYHKNYETEAYKLDELFPIAGKSYNFDYPKLKYESIKSYNSHDWIEVIKDYNPKNFSCVIFIISKINDGKIYSALKQHSLCEYGYLSQGISIESIRNIKAAMSIVSKILNQINNKMGGSQYIMSKFSSIKNKNLMIVGVDSSHIKGRRTGVAMVATRTNDFSSFYSKEEIINEENKEQLVFKVGEFINKAIEKYFKTNKSFPNGVIIYRQGVGESQKEFLKEEVQVIERYLRGEEKSSILFGSNSNTIPYYYILVNKKANFKYFEQYKNDYLNPENGLLIMNNISGTDKFEFCIQPQKVTQGSATPTYYHVAFGNLNIPEDIPKLTFDLCGIYPNWCGHVRVPHVLKNAEKLSKMVSKVVLKELHPNLQDLPSYL